MEARRKKITFWISIAVAILIVAIVILNLIWGRPPEIREPEPTPTPEVTAEPEPTPEPMPEGEAMDTGRQDGVYTILLVGIDQMSMSTDVIMVAKFDTVRHEVNVVSIPRDTIINVDWDPRKINAVYAGSANFGGNGIDALAMHVRRMVGFTPDCYAVLNLNTFIEVIDLLGGVDFVVPQEVNYFFDDIEMRLYIHLNAGPQHLNGRQAMALVRYRQGYIDGDLGRLELQHSFLSACAEQFITLGNIPNARAVIRTLSENLSTDLSSANIAWFLRQALLCRAENIHFSTMPCEPRNIQNYSYAVPHIDEWLTMLNSTINPLDREIGYGDLDIVYCGWGGSYGATTMLDGAWYYE